MSLPASGSKHLTGNIPAFSGTASSATRIRLWLSTVGDANLIYDETLTPENGTVSVDLRNVLKDYLGAELPGATSPTLQTDAMRTFIYQFGASGTQTSFTVVNCGLDGKSYSTHASSATAAATFLTANFLTWQPQTKHISISQPEYLTYRFIGVQRMIARAYYASGTSVAHKDVVLYTSATGTNAIYTVDVAYNTVKNSLTNITPSYYDIYIVDSTYTLDQESVETGRVSYIQRYVAVSSGERDQYYLWKNSLGGIDTLRCTGKLLYKPSHESELYTIDDIAQESDPDITTSWSQNTGFIESQGQGQWLADFLTSTARYHLVDSDLRRIVMESQEQEYDILSPSGFSFEYSYADQTIYGFINRSQTLEALSTIADPSLFFLNNIRLADYPSATIDNGLLFAVQTPYGSDWKKLTIEDLANFLTQSGTVTGSIAHIKMNGSDLPIDSDKRVDLGTVITAHQDISGKQDTISDLETIRSDASTGATHAGTSHKVTIGSTEVNTLGGEITNLAGMGTGTFSGQVQAGSVLSDGGMTAYASGSQAAGSILDSIPVDTSTLQVNNGVLKVISGSGVGSVTSVAMTVPTGLSVTGSPITSSGTLALTFATGYSIPTTAKQTEWDGKVDANTAIAGATKCKVTYDSKGLVTAGADLSASDIPELTASKITSGTFDAARIPSLNASKITDGTFADARIASASTWNAKAKSYSAEITGDGTSTSYEVSHSLGHKNIALTLYDSSDNVVLTDISVSATKITVTFAKAVPSNTKYRLVYVG